MVSVKKVEKREAQKLDDLLQISENTLNMMDKSMNSIKAGITGKSVNVEMMTAGQIREKIQRGLDDVEAGRFRDLDEIGKVIG